MKLKKFKEKNTKKIGIITFTIICILLVSGVILYRTFASFEVNHHFNIINGTIEDPGNIYFAFYVNDGKENKIQKEMPTRNYVLDEENSFCEVNGERDEKIKVTLTDEYGIYITGVTSSRTKCNLYFVSGAFILGKPIKAITSGEGLYEVTHEDVSGTINDNGFKETEFRYAGKDPNNYIWFNDELWRIIGLVNVMVDENRVEQRIKIIKSESIGNYAWDTNNINDWTKASLMKELNENYYDTLNDNAKSLIDENITWNIGGEESSNKLLLEYYKFERGNKTYNGRDYIWYAGNTISEKFFHSIGLIYPSDYGYATSGGEVTTREKCFSQTLYTLDTECGNNNFLKPRNNSMWTLTLASHTKDYAFRIAHFSGGVSIPDDFTVSTQFLVYPTLYLKSNVKIMNNGQDGSIDNPYHLQQIL